MIESFVHDVRYAIRGLARMPMIATAAVLSLALGIGANTAIFSLVNAVILRSLPVRSPQELVQIGWLRGKSTDRFVQVTSGRGVEMFGQNVRLPFSLDTYNLIRARSTTLVSVAGRLDLTYSDAVVIAQRRSDTARANLVSGNFFDTLGVVPEAGRLFADDDDREGAQPVVALSWSYWMRRFAGDERVIGTPILINGAEYTVTGVVVRGFTGVEVGSSPDLYVPLHHHPLITAKEGFKRNILHAPEWWWVEIMGRRKAGVTDAQIHTELETLFRQSLTPTGSEPVKSEDYPKLVIGSPHDIVSGLRYQFSKPLMVLWTIVGAVLLIACANVANLLLARAAARRKEMAMRHALGARPARLFRQAIVESVVLAFVGGALGLAIARFGAGVLVRIVSSESNPLSLDVHADTRVLAFLAALSVAVGLLFGVVPAIESSRVDLNTLIKGASAEGRRFGPGRILVAAQVAMSLALLVGAGLYLRTLWNFRHVALGFNPENVLTFRLAPKRGGYEKDALLRLLDRVSSGIASIPGVRGVSYSHIGLLKQVQTSGPFEFAGEKPDESKFAKMLYVAPNFFDTMQIRLAGGRAFDNRDSANAPRVAVVNESLVKQFFARRAALGQRITYWIDKYQRPMEIVGVVKNAKYQSVTTPTEQIIYLPYAQNLDAVQEAVFVVRTAGDPRAAATGVREALRSVDPELPAFAMTTETTLRDENLRDQRLMADLAGAFAALALFLAAVGLYGVIAHSILRRTAEIGIRMALGADRARVLRQVLGESMAMAGIGALVGLAAALGATRLIASQLFGLEPRDPATMIGAAGLILAVALAATIVPARRASRIDPMDALRHE